MFGADLLLRILGPLLLAGGVALLAFGGFKYVENIGYVKAEAKYKPQVAKLDKDLAEAHADNAQLAVDVTKWQEIVAKQNASFTALAEQDRAVQTAKEEALKRVAAQQLELRKQINHYLALAAEPAGTKTEACNAADSILRELADHRVRQ